MTSATLRRTVIIILCTAIAVYLMRINNYLYDNFRDSLHYREIRERSTQYDALRDKNYAPQYTHIVIVVLDGATRAYLNDERTVPNIIRRWRRNGIRYANAFCMLPSVSAPNYYSILSGAPVFLHGVTNNYRRYPRHQRIGTIFDHLKRYRFSSAVIGFNWYKDMISGRTAYIPVECCEADDSVEVTAAAIRLIENRKLPTVTLLHYLAPDNRAHATGSNTSDAYRKAIVTIDRCVEDLFQHLERRYPRSLMIVLSDHGMNSDGNHGGRDRNSLNIPLYLIADDIPSGESDRRVYNLSIVPTISALLGIPLPPLSAGSMLHEIIESERVIDYLQESIAKKQALINSLRKIDTVNFTAGEDLRASLITRDEESTEEIVHFIGERRSEILSLQRIIAAVLLLLFVIWMLYRTESGIPLFAALNGIMILLMGCTMSTIESRIGLDIAIALYLIVLFLLLILYRTTFLTGEFSERLNDIHYSFRLLEIILPLTIIIAGFFVPFQTPVPDENIFSFRFYQLSFLHPFLFSFLLYLMNRI